MAPLYWVFIGVIGASVFVGYGGTKIYYRITNQAVQAKGLLEEEETAGSSVASIYDKYSVLEAKLRITEAKLRTSEAKIKTARAEAFNDAYNQFVMHGYASECSRNQAKTVPKKDDDKK